MKYYTIQNEQLIMAENEQALTRFYGNVLPLPNDYEERKYIIIDEELVLNPNWEEEKQELEIMQKKEEIKAKLDELDKKRIRAICENEIKDENTGETWIEFYNEQAVKLRQELSSI